MNKSDGDCREDKRDGDRRESRRSFLLSGGGLLTSAWLAVNWPAIAAAAHHAEEAAAGSAPAAFAFLSAGDAADVEAISAQIVPSGATPGAREAHAVYFIDRAMSTFFSAQAQDFRAALSEFQTKFAALHASVTSFAKASPEEQISHLKTVDGTPFFASVRTLTLLGMFSSPKYGGNYQGSGWKMMGFVDQHAFAPPFGYYDREYTGFVPYAGAAKEHS
jgi:gluconate 2-dehydrogenase gamma chain